MKEYHEYSVVDTLVKRLLFPRFPFQPARKAIYKRKMNYKRTLQIMTICISMKMKYTEKIIRFQARQTLLQMQLDTFQIDYNSKHILFQIYSKYFFPKYCISYLKDNSRNRECL